MPFLCTPRVLNSTEGRVALQITDLFPHKTQSNAVITPRFKGPLYLYAHGRSLTATPVLDVQLDLAEVSGLSAYILLSVPDNINQNGNGAAVALSVANADLIAGDIITRMQNGQSLTLADINTIIAARAGNGIGIGLGGATATVLQILQIVSGYKVFTAPAGTSVADADALNAFDGPNAQGILAMISDPADASKLFTSFSNNDSFFISARSGQLKKAQLATDKSGNPAPLVVIYDDNGNLIQ